MGNFLNFAKKIQKGWVSKSSHLSKRSLYTLIFLAVILLGGVVALARNGNLNIFADTPTALIVNVTSLDSGAPVIGVFVDVIQGSTLYYATPVEGHIGKYSTTEIPTGTYNISIGGLGGPNCTSSANFNLSSSHYIYDVSIHTINCDGVNTDSVTPTLSPSPSPSVFHTSSVTTSSVIPSPSPSPSAIIYNPHSQDLQFQGKVSVYSTAVPGAQIRIHCPATYSSWCASNNVGEATAYSSSPFQPNNNQQENYLGTFAYNIAKPAAQFTTLEGSFCAPAGYTLQNGDSCSVFNINATDIQHPATSTDKSFIAKDFTLIVKPSPSPSPSPSLIPSPSPVASASPQAQLVANLTLDPIMGDSPSKVTLKAVASGSATGKLNYSFWWNCTSTSNIVSTVIAACGDPSSSSVGAKFDNITATSKSLSHTFSVDAYTTYKIFSPKIIIERGSANPATDTKLTSAESSPSSVETIPVMVLDTNSLAPLESAKVMFNCPNGGKSVAQQTTDYGITKFPLPNLAQTCSVTIGWHNQTVTRQMNIPKDLYSQARAQMAQTFKQFVVFLDAFQPAENSISGSLPIKIVDQGTGKAIVGAKVDVSAPIEAYGYTSMGGFPLGFGVGNHATATTDSSGIAYVNPKNITFGGKQKKFFLWSSSQGLAQFDTFIVKVTANGYPNGFENVELDMLRQSTDPVIVRMERASAWKSIVNSLNNAYQSIIGNK